MRPRRYATLTTAAWCSVALVPLVICGCAAVDQFSSRAQDYNHQTADSKGGQILLNVVRSAYSQPLQFTDVSTVAATSSLSGTLGATVPFPLNIAAISGVRTIAASPSATATGGSTVNVANLNTQEFYQGLQKPLTNSQIDYYLFSGFYDLYPSELLPLFISEIDIKNADGTTFVLRNRGTSPQSFNRFYFATSQLLKGGLSTEQAAKAKPTKVGPELEVQQASDPKLLSALVTGSSAPSTSSTGSDGSGSGEAGGFTLQPITKKVDGEKKTFYQLQKNGGAGGAGGDRFCFSTTWHPQNDLDLSMSKPIKEKEHLIFLGLENEKYVWPVAVHPSLYCGRSSGSRAAGGSEKISFKTRSIEEIFYFLGQIVRTELGIASGEEASLAIPSSDGSTFRLFHVEHRLPVGEEPWVMYNGQIFSIRIDPSGKQDASSRVLQMMTDLLALQSSAKNLPAPNLIAVTTQ